jgi:hypothetical protein
MTETLDREVERTAEKRDAKLFVSGDGDSLPLQREYRSHRLLPPLSAAVADVVPVIYRSRATNSRAGIDSHHPPCVHLR